MKFNLIYVGLTTALLVGLKLAGLIDGAWWLVLSPLWVGTILAALLLAVRCLSIWYHQKR